MPMQRPVAIDPSHRAPPVADPGRATARRAVWCLASAAAALIWIGLAALPVAAQAPGAATPPAGLAALIAGKQRTAPNVVRDPWRKPLDVLTFLDIRPESTVVEISPGAAGYWTEILAPYLSARGLYVAANPAPRSPAAKANIEKFNAEFAAKMAADPASFGKVRIVLWAPELPDTFEPSTADFVLTFRNLHNWMDRGVVDKALASFYRVLKRGGTLGIKDHRGRTDQPQDAQAKSGYVRQDYTIALVEKAGFRFAGSSEAVANPKDTKDHPAGVWTLPPTYRLKDQDRAKYAAIGESDRYLLKFVKP
jgi:predicted methyltransferase